MQSGKFFGCIVILKNIKKNEDAAVIRSTFVKQIGLSVFRINACRYCKIIIQI